VTRRLGLSDQQITEGWVYLLGRYLVIRQPTSVSITLATESATGGGRHRPWSP